MSEGKGNLGPGRARANVPTCDAELESDQLGELGRDAFHWLF